MKKSVFIAFLVLISLLSLFILTRGVRANVPFTPQGPYAACNPDLKSVHVNWYPVWNADTYSFRLDAKPRSWSESCNLPGDRCISTTNNYIDIPITPEVEYDWWVHAVNTEGYSSALDGVNFTCTIPRPTGFYYRCEANNTKLYINWRSHNGLDAERYELRFDANPSQTSNSSWSENCNNLYEGDICRTATQKETTISIEPGVRYKWWVHGAVGNVWTEGVDAGVFTCGDLPTPTPTNTPTPTQTPTFTPTMTPTNSPIPTPTNTPVPTSTPFPTSTPVPTLTFTPTPTLSLTPTQIPSNTHTPSPTISVVERDIDICPRRAEGDADCNNAIEINDFTCWRAQYIEKTLLVAQGCLDTDFNDSDSTTLFDYAIWYVSFMKERF